MNDLRQVGDEFPNDTIYIFGHGNPGYGVTGSREDVLRKADFLEALLTKAQQGIDAGMSKEEISSLDVLPGFEEYQLEGWSLTLKFNLETAYDELSNTR